MPLIMEGTRPLTGPALTNDLCSQNVKVKVKTAHATVGAENFQPLHHPRQCGFDFNILTAFIRLGRARPAGAGCPP